MSSSSFPVLLLSVLLLLTVAVSEVHGRIAGDEVTSLPGFSQSIHPHPLLSTPPPPPPLPSQMGHISAHPYPCSPLSFCAVRCVSAGALPSRHYSGLLAVDSPATVYLHYWFVESTGPAPSAAPLLVWMNGGPGCSSMEGFLYELGPLHFTGNRTESGLPTLQVNPSAWTTVANVLFIENPAGVGFSFSVNHSVETNDDVVSQNGYGFLKAWYRGFPEYSNNSLFLTGESYAGIYIPQLAWRIYEGAKVNDNTFPLQGFAVGNACWGNAVGECASYSEGRAVSPYEGVKDFLTFFHGHAMLSEPHWKQLNAACQNFTVKTDPCDAAIAAAYKDQGPYYVYNIYDQCGVSTDHLLTALDSWASAHHVRREGAEVAVPFTPDFCLDPTLNVDWFRTPSVQAALHVTASNQTAWVQCSTQVSRGYNRSVASLLPLYPSLISAYRVLVYAGEVDACVPYVGSEQWTRGLGYPVKEEWRPWLVQSQVAGYVTEYAAPHQFTFLTVKGAGHRVPNYQPEPALAFISRWIAGQPF